MLQRETAAVPAVRARPALIAAIARESMESMADIVWAVDPARDRVGDLARRMRRVAEEALGSGPIAFEFQAPLDQAAVPMHADLRRAILLVFKEALNNCVRHAGCRTMRISLAVARGRVTLVVDDDGRGFDPERAHEGNGLRNMSRRAAAVGGALGISSTPGRGTRIAFSAVIR